jgi:hypothetical protein
LAGDHRASDGHTGALFWKPSTNTCRSRETAGKEIQRSSDGAETDRS